ncbi:MAG: ectonucleotide pyrophosphatase/phosphodiesterase [Acidobacteriia bacterium]|nr:ectonucleotide pyrophosphatase/phosphodiesterase [Terriglobia bacterium]
MVVISLDGFPAYALDDPRLPIPTLRKLAREGAVAASMQPINPTVTWPNHTAIVTGVDASEHQVLFNGLLTRPEGGARPTIEPWRDKDVMVHAPTIYDVAYQAGLTTAQVDWVAIYRAKTITWQFPELPDPNGPIERELIADGTVTAEQLRTFEDSSQAWQDEIWTDAAVKILEKHKPNLLLFHLLTLDDTNHEYGPMSPASFTAMASLDSRVKQIVDVLQSTGLSRKATLIIVSDHGFRAFKHKIHPNVLLRQKGLLGEGQGHPKADAWVLPTGGTAMVYLTNPDRKVELLPELRSIFTGVEGIDRVYGGEDLPKLGLPVPAASDQAPDLVLAAAPDYAFSNESEGDYATQVPVEGTHGYLNTDPKMQSIFIAWGAGIPKGIHLNSISNLDVAPTLAALLGLEMKLAKGHPIEQIVKHGAGQ